MKLFHRCQIPAEREKVWDFLMNVPEVAACIPGVSGPVTPVDGGYEGVLKARVGIINVTLEGRIEIEKQDRENWQAAMRAAARSRQGGGHLRSRVAMSLEASGEHESELLVETDVNLLGRLGELGMPLVRRTADSMMAEFTRNVRRRLSEHM
jgi:uncharacterized protein